MIDHNNLEEFTDPANYDIEEEMRSEARIRFYANLAQEIGGSALEAACGTGLAALAIAACGIPITGIDLARPMLAHARVKAHRQNQRINLVEADARQFHFAEQFAFIYITGNAFQAFLRRRDQERFLACVKRHLAPNGIFAFETRNPSGHDLTDRPEEEHWYTYHNVDGQRVEVSGKQRYDPLTQVMHWRTFRRWQSPAGPRETSTRIACRFTDARELEALLQENGFRIVEQYGDWNKNRFTVKSEAIISVSRHLDR